MLEGCDFATVDNTEENSKPQTGLTTRVHSTLRNQSSWLIDFKTKKKTGLTQYQQPLQEKTRNQAGIKSLYEDLLAFLVHSLKILITKTPFPTRSTRNLVTATSTHGTRTAENLSGEGSHSAPPPGVGVSCFMLVRGYSSWLRSQSRISSPLPTSFSQHQTWFWICSSVIHPQAETKKRM